MLSLRNFKALLISLSIPMIGEKVSIPIGYDEKLK